MTSLSNSAVEAYILMNVKNVVKSNKFIIKFKSTRNSELSLGVNMHSSLGLQIPTNADC